MYQGKSKHISKEVTEGVERSMSKKLNGGEREVAEIREGEVLDS